MIINAAFFYNMSPIATAAEAEAIASQLPGRVGGPGDALRHIIASAEVTRVYSAGFSENLGGIIEFIESGNDSNAASSMDLVSNQIGRDIGEYVKNNNGTYEDVVRLSKEAIQNSLAPYKYTDFTNNIDVVNYSESANSLGISDKGNLLIPGKILLDGGRLQVDAISLLPFNEWKNNPSVGNNYLATEQSNWPDFNGDWLNKFVAEPYKYTGAEGSDPIFNTE